MKKSNVVEPITSETREKQSLIRGDVLEVEGAKPKSRFSGRREKKITLQMSAKEAHELETRAKAAGLKLSPYIRRQLMSAENVSREATLVLAEVGRVRELVTRLWSVASEGELDAPRVVEIADAVGAIEARVLVARALQGK